MDENHILARPWTWVCARLPVRVMHVRPVRVSMFLTLYIEAVWLLYIRSMSASFAPSSHALWGRCATSRVGQGVRSARWCFGPPTANQRESFDDLLAVS